MCPCRRSPAGRGRGVRRCRGGGAAGGAGPARLPAGGPGGWLGLGGARRGAWQAWACAAGAAPPPATSPNRRAVCAAPAASRAQEARRAVGGGVKVAFASLKDSVALEVPEVRLPSSVLRAAGRPCCRTACCRAATAHACALPPPAAGPMVGPRRATRPPTPSLPRVPPPPLRQSASVPADWEPQPGKKGYKRYTTAQLQVGGRRAACDRTGLRRCLPLLACVRPWAGRERLAGARAPEP